MADPEHSIPEGARRVASVRLVLPERGSEAEAALALATGKVVVPATTLLAAVPTITVPCEELGRRGFTIGRDAADHLHIYFAPRRIAGESAPGAPRQAPTGLALHSDRIVVPVGGVTEAVLVAFDTGVALRIEPGWPPRIDLFDLEPRPMVPTAPDLPSWLLPDASTDPWLRLVAIETLEARGPLAAAVAAGQLLRLGEHTEAEHAFADALVAAAVADSTSPLPDVPTAPAHRWFQSLGAEVRERFEAAGLRALDVLAEELEDARDAAAPATAIIAAAIRRDDLEGVAWLLAADGRTSLQTGLRALDGELGAALLKRYPGVGRGSDRLERAAEAQPGGWWTELAYESDE